MGAESTETEDKAQDAENAPNEANGEAETTEVQVVENEGEQEDTVGDLRPLPSTDEDDILELPAMENYHTVDEKTRNEIHNKLRTYENRRRMAYSSKLESSSLYWRAFRSLLEASVHETSRAERLVKGAARANKAFAESMMASYDDIFLDDKGQIVTDPKRQKKLLDMRSQQDYVGAPLPAKSDAKKKSQLMEERKNSKSNLTALIDSQANMARKFGDNATQLEGEILSEISILREGFEAKVYHMRVIGDMVIAELEKIEMEVAVAWDAYYACAVEALRGSSLVVASTADEDGNPVAEKCKDVWLVEMQYRVAVAYQSSAWEKGSSQLTKLFTTMKKMECNRRIDLREYMVAFMQRQERLFAGLPDIHTPVLRNLVERDMERTALEENVQNAIRKRAEKLQRDDFKAKQNGSGPAGLDSTDKKDGNFSLESPLVSELLHKAKVIERKTGGMMSTWKVCLSVITTDSYLHMFDIPTATRVSQGSAPEVAFQVLVPKVELPSAETLKTGRSNFIRGWCDHLSPVESLNLHNCRILPGSDGTTVDIHETIISTGASSLMFGKTQKRKLAIRTLTKFETMDFIRAVHHAQE